ncbi:SdrD B-like domain-containing protein [Patulibacter sp. SYSU D01012]|uniref:SdrD B-like domain-containing protein n=1 Tax=Patulibacter sp. SYSU D01012 TaxID=2817381 RepID=UPI001B3097E9
MLLVALAALGVLPAAASAAYPSEAAYVCAAERQDFEGAPLSQRSILHPGCGNLVGMERFGEPGIQAYYRQFGFDRNFMVWAPRQVRWDVAGRIYSGCITPHANGTLCAGGPENVRYRFAPQNDWNGPTTVKMWGDGFIALACGNLSATGTRQGPVPRVSGTKYEDANGNGRRDAGEPGLAGVRVRLSRDGAELASTVTASDGTYAFALNAEADARYTQGTYAVSEDVPAGYRQTAAPGAVFVPYGAADATYGGLDFGNQKVTDVGIQKTVDAPQTVAGTSATWTLTVTNHGRWAAPGVVVTDELPAELDRVDEIDPACEATGRTVRCRLGDLGAGERRLLRITARVAADVAKGTTIRNVASVTTDMPDTAPGNDRDAATTTVDTQADLVAGKRAASWRVLGGGVAEYVLSVRNDGPSWARSVVLRDALPAEIAFVDTDDPVGCAAVGPTITCAVGDLAPGAEARVVVHGRAVGAPPPAPTPSHDDHLLAVDKAEQAVSLEAGERRTVDVDCPAGGLVTDGSVRVDAVDQGTGSKADVRTLESVATARSRYRATVENRAAGRAQVHVGATCLRPTTVGGDGAAHDLVADDPVASVDALEPGRRTVRLRVGLDRHAVAPGYEVRSGDARLVGSEPTDDGWELTFLVTERAVVRSSVVPLHGRLATVDGHTHRLVFAHPRRDVSLPPGESEQQIDCAPEEKGITASWSTPAGAVHLGDEARPRTRAFRFLNTGAVPVDAVIDVVCLAERTGPPLDPVGVVRNTVRVSSATAETDADDDEASADVVIDRAVVGPDDAPVAAGPASSADRTATVTPGAHGPERGAAAQAPTLGADAPAGAANARTAAPGPSAAALVGRPRLDRRASGVRVRLRCAAGQRLAVEVRRNGRTLGAAGVRCGPAGATGVLVRVPRRPRATARGLAVVVRDGARAVARGGVAAV